MRRVVGADRAAGWTPSFRAPRPTPTTATTHRRCRQCRLARTILEAAGAAGSRAGSSTSARSSSSCWVVPRDENTPLTPAGGQGWTDPYLRSKVEAEVVGRESRQPDCPGSRSIRGRCRTGRSRHRDERPFCSGRAARRPISATPGRRGSTSATWRAAVILALDARPGARSGLTSGVVGHRRRRRVARRGDRRSSSPDLPDARDRFA